MFGLLNPFLLWLAPLLAGPLILHFLGRAEPRTRDFPSLLPVRGKLVRAMQRHRLKNWLQLLLRTLVLLCLLLAAAGLVWRAPARWTPPETTALLVHNGVYGSIPALSDAQQGLRRGLDSLASGRNDVELVIEDAPPGRTVARFGRYPEAVSRLLRRADQAAPASSSHVFLPVFDTRDLKGLVDILRPWLERHPRGRVALMNYTVDPQASEFLSPFRKVAADFSKESQVALRVPLSPEAASFREGKAPLWIPENGPARETRLEDARVPRWAEIILPLPESGYLAGSLVLNAAGPKTFAESLAAVSYRVPPPAALCVVSPRSGWVARATLGEGGKRLKVVPLLPGAEFQAARCDLLYLADPEDPDAALLARAVAVLRGGGKVILGTGRHTDATLLNRNLLIPLGAGRLTGISTHASLAARAKDASLAAKLGVRANAWGRPGAVRTHLGFLPGPGTTVLLSAQDAGTEVPLLVYARAGAAGGELLLWTTDIGDPEWSDIGLGPWVALMHQSFLGRAWSAGAQARATDSDSTLFFSLAEGETDGEPPRVRDPQGNLVALWHPEPGGGRAGPFDRLGLYRLETARDTIRFAVNLADERLPSEKGAAADEDAWDDFYATLGKDASARTERLDEPAAWRSLYGGFNLRLSLLVLAALLLFAEGVVSLRLSPFRN